ncbi:MAG: hypothetical protein Q4A32_10210, partial [Lachnospiraceae bacterium]|nr:hypothetical protein [Lachnospiraceae bacterium]
MNSAMHSILLKVYQMRFPGEQFALRGRKSGSRVRFRQLYDGLVDKDPESITWNYVSEYASRTKNCKNCLFLVLVLLETGHGLKDHKAALMRLYPSLVSISRQHTFGAWARLFSGDKIEDTFIHEAGKVPGCAEDAKRLILYLPYGNKYIQEEMFQHYRTIGRMPQSYAVKFTLLFEESLDGMESGIHTYTDFTDTTFWTQANHFKNRPDLTDKEANICLRQLAKFYRYLVNEHADHHYFGNSLHLSEALLFSPAFVTRIEQGFHVEPFDQHADYHNRKRMIFLLRGYSSLSTMIKDDDFVSLDFSAIKSDFYRNELFKYYVSMPSATVATWAGHTGYMRDALAMLESVKSENDYPNPDRKYMTNQEALLIRSFFSDESVRLSTRNNKIGAIRRFLMWERDENKQISFDDMFFEYLVQYEEPSKTHGESIPDEDLGKISAWLAAQSTASHEMDLTYAALHLALETEFRISQVCHLKVGCIKPSAKPHEYIVQTYHKTGHGRLGSFVISELTYRHLVRIIENTEPYREKCTRRGLSEYIFLYDGTMNTVSLMDSQKFRAWFQQACAALDLPKYTSQNIRDTHMTKSFEYVLKHGKSDLVMAALSKHKYLDTTKSHYVEQKLNDMLEATYGIIIGDLDGCYDPARHIAEKIPEDFDSDENVVESGCGNCKSAQCTMRNALPCLICDKFITTVK